MITPSRILVTGGAGFVGSHVTEFYAKQGADVTAVDNLSRAETLEADENRNTAKHNWQYLQEEFPKVKLVEADVRDFEKLRRLVEGHDAVVHTAGQVAVTASLENPRTDFEINTGGTFNVLEAASKADSDPVVVFASTNKVYGENVNKIPVREEEQRYAYDDSEYESGIPETYPIDDTEHTPYGVSKLAADLYVQDYAARNEVDAAAFRMSCIYGPRQYGNEDQGWVAHFALSALRDEEVTIFGDGKQVRDVLYVKDLVRAYDAFLSDPDGKSAIYNIGGGPEHTTSLLEFMTMLENETGRKLSRSFEQWRQGDQRVYISDISRAKVELDWQPKVNISEGITRYLDWAESNNI